MTTSKPPSGTDIYDEPWAPAFGFNEQDLERERVATFLARVQQVLSQERTVVTRVVQSEGRTTDGEGKGFRKYQKERVRLSIEIEWDEWHPLPNRYGDEGG